jgi:hypothetical protein
VQARHHFVLEVLVQVERGHQDRIGSRFVVSSIPKFRAVKSLLENTVALRSFTRLLSFNLSLIIAALAREFTQHRFVVAENVDVRVLHIVVFYVLVVWLKLALDPRHLCADFLVLLGFELSFKVLTHKSWIFGL